VAIVLEQPLTTRLSRGFGSGGLDVQITARRRLGNPATRRRMRKRLLVVSGDTDTVTLTVARPCTVRNVIVGRDSRWRLIVGQPGLRAKPSEHFGRRQCHVDEQRHHRSHVHLRRRGLGLGGRRAGWPVFVHVPVRGNISLSLHDSPGNGGKRCRSLTRRRLECARLRRDRRFHSDDERAVGECAGGGDNIDGYTDGKTDTILRILEMAGLSADERDHIERINRLAV
jgi:hypothetical protein